MLPTLPHPTTIFNLVGPLQVPEGTAPDRLAAEVVGRAAAKVQRLLHYRSLPGAAHRRSGSSTGARLGSGAAGVGAGSVATGLATGCCPAGASEAGLLLERRLLGEVEAARERCKRDAILARLQAELPSCQVGSRTAAEVAAWPACCAAHRLLADRLVGRQPLWHAVNRVGATLEGSSTDPISASHTAGSVHRAGGDGSL